MIGTVRASHRLADGQRFDADLVVIGVGVLPATELAEAAGGWGRPVDLDRRLYDAGPAGVLGVAAEVTGDVIAAAAEALSPSAIVAGGTDRGNEMLAHAAAVLDLPFVANCLSVTAGDGDWAQCSRAWQVGYIRGLMQALGI